MERTKKITIITFLVLFLSAAVIFALLFYESGKTEDTYNQALSAIDEKNWESAYDLIKQVPHYKSAEEIEAYVYPVMTYYKKYNTMSEQLSGLQALDAYIDANIESMSSEDYRNKLMELKEAIAFQEERLNVLAEYDQETGRLEECVTLIGEGKLDEAAEKLANLTSIRYSKEQNQLTAYIAFLKAVASGNVKEVRSAASLLDPAYSGRMSEDIKAAVGQSLDDEQWNKLYQTEAERAQKEAEKNAAKNENAEPKTSTIASIGDEKTGVIQLMGSPKSSQVIDSDFGKLEKLMYPGNVIIYLEDGNVTAVKG